MPESLIESLANLKTLVRIFTFIFLLFTWLTATSQTQISGTINKYAKVTAINGLDDVTVDNSSGFKSGDTVLLIQMKGADYDANGNYLLGMNYTGRYEFIAVQSVIGNDVKFRSNFLNTYDDPPQALQIVKVPSYTSAVVTSQLTGKPWDGASGGVIAFFVLDTLELKADINANGLGFIGGASTFGSSLCNSSTKNNFYPSASDSAGLKGESIIRTTYPYTRGRGGIANGGGGGNGFGSGGGGGAGYGNGGLGCQTSASKCASAAIGGKPGTGQSDFYAGTLSETRDRIFMGGGGGSSRGSSAGDASVGGNGGGIVFIISSGLKTNGYSIKSSGANASPALNDAGAGGGGGGGSVLLSINSAIDSLKVEVNGGNGGDAACSGRGGGGGGGFVWFSDNSLPFSKLIKNSGALGSYTTPPCTITSGTVGYPGDSANHLNPVLNGFLFNLIFANQTICYGDIPLMITGTNPRGGNGIFSYKWQYRNKSTANVWTDINGATSRDYQSPALFDTTDFRRVVSSTELSTGNPVSDSSRWIRIKVRPEIKGLAIAPADTAICYKLNPVLLRGAVTYGGDGSTLAYLWQESADNSTWNNTSFTPGNEKDFAGTSNTDTKYYRRKVYNANCVVFSNVSHVTVYPKITNNNLQPDSVICMGASPNSIHSISTLSGGDAVYRYQWLKNSTDSLHWTPTSNADTFAVYLPGSLTDTVFYKRIVYSGLRNTCIDTSQRVKITVLSLISNNTISADQVICQNTSPNRFIGSSPAGGDRSYRYQWELSDDNSLWSNAPLQTTDSVSLKYGILQVASPKYFRRTIFSGAYNCCKSTSVSIRITVQPKIENNLIADTSEICFGQSPAQLSQKSGTLSGGDNAIYNYLWQKKIQNGAWKDTTGANEASFLPGSLYQTTYFRRKVTSGTCENYSDSLKINVLPLITGNTKPTGALEACQDSVPLLFVGPQVAGGKEGVYRYYWQSSSNGATWDSIPNAHGKNYQSPALEENLIFRRIVKSGYNDCCISVGDTFQLTVSKHPSIPDAGKMQELKFQFTTKLHALPVAVGWGEWSTKNQDINIVAPKDTATEVYNMPFGKNMFYWTVSSGSCPKLTDSVLILVDDIKRYTGFSPNGDKSNEYFVIDGATNSKVRKLHVFNRWGAEVYSSDDYNNDWNGTAKNGQPLPEDTYYYIFEADDNRIYKGFFVIRR